MVVMYIGTKSILVGLVWSFNFQMCRFKLCDMLWHVMQARFTGHKGMEISSIKHSIITAITAKTLERKSVL